MPIMDIQVGDQINNTMEIISILQHPNINEDRHPCKAACIMHSYTQSHEDDLMALDEMATFSEYIRVARQTSNVIDFVTSEADFFLKAHSVGPFGSILDEKTGKKILTVGVVYLLYYSLKIDGRERIGLKKTVYIVSQLSKVSEKTIWAYIKRYRSAVHLCCAFYLFQCSLNDKAVAGEDILCPKNIDYFISASEFFRLYFEGLVEPVTKKAVLDNKITWKAPSGFPVEPTTITIPEDISKPYKKLLDGYTKRHLPDS